MNKIIILSLFFAYNIASAQTISISNMAEETDSILKSYCNYHEPGMAIGIVRNGKVIYKNAIGVADLSNNISISDSTVFNVASVSKQFTALLALIAESEGKISLQDNIVKYLPELKKLPYEITIKQLANQLKLIYAINNKMIDLLMKIALFYADTMNISMINKKKFNIEFYPEDIISNNWNIVAAIINTVMKKNR